MKENILPIHTLAIGINFPEGPVFLPDGNLWLVEKDAGNLIRYQAGEIQRFAVGGLPNGLALDAQGLIWYCDAGNNSICTFDPLTQAKQSICSELEGVPLFMPNDLAFDAIGNLIFTCPGDRLKENKGYVCCLDLDGKLSRIATGMDYPNGLAFDASNNGLYIAETGTGSIWFGDWDAQTKLWTRSTPVINTAGAVGPDGMAFDELGNLYIAVYGDGKINVYNNKQEFIQEIKLSGSNPTNCAFDPTGSLGLVITEAQTGELLHIPLPYKGIL